MVKSLPNPTVNPDVFYYDGKPVNGEYLVILSSKSGPQELPGWYYFAGDDPIGPWKTRKEAEEEFKIAEAEWLALGI